MDKQKKMSSGSKPTVSGCGLLDQQSSEILGSEHGFGRFQAEHRLWHEYIDGFDGDDWRPAGAEGDDGAEAPRRRIPARQR